MIVFMPGRVGPTQLYKFGISIFNYNNLVVCHGITIIIIYDISRVISSLDVVCNICYCCTVRKYSFFPRVSNLCFTLVTGN